MVTEVFGYGAEGGEGLRASAGQVVSLTTSTLTLKKANELKLGGRIFESDFFIVMKMRH